MGPLWNPYAAPIQLLRNRQATPQQKALFERIMLKRASVRVPTFIPARLLGNKGEELAGEIYFELN